MSETPANFGNQRRRGLESPGGGPLLLVVFSVAAAVVFCFLYVREIGMKSACDGRSPDSPATPAIMPPAVREETANPPYEPTSIAVEQVLVVEAPGGKGKAEKVLVRVPAVFPSGTVRWSPEQMEAARALHGRLVAIARHQDALDRELQRVEKQWNQLIQFGLPTEALYPDSPSLPSLTQP